uniref:ZP domain-containing protein n=1 Tax=Ditylenchus dipsaci TaxID=166011 RepID=A0A915D815_9BILA
MESFWQKYNFHITDNEVQDGDRGSFYQVLMGKICDECPEFKGTLAFTNTQGKEVIIDCDSALRQALAESHNYLKLHTILNISSDSATNFVEHRPPSSLLAASDMLNKKFQSSPKRSNSVPPRSPYSDMSLSRDGSKAYDQEANRVIAHVENSARYYSSRSPSTAPHNSYSPGAGFHPAMAYPMFLPSSQRYVGPNKLCACHFFVNLFRQKRTQNKSNEAVTVQAETTDSSRQTTAKIFCSKESIGIEISNATASQLNVPLVRKPLRIFASRRLNESACVQNILADADEVIKFELPLQTSKCGVVSRSNLTGEREYYVRLVISYDNTQITEDDQFLDLHCRYSSVNYGYANTSIQISSFSKTTLNGNGNISKSENPERVGLAIGNSSSMFTSPFCNYSLHINSYNGPLADNAQLGDKVYHKWKCDEKFRVYECFVHDGANRRHLLIDEHGCSVDPSIMPDLVYDSKLDFVYAPSWVFKFTNSTKMFFNCLLYMCPKSDSNCNGTRPICKRSRSFRRNKRSELQWRRKLFTIGANGPVTFETPAELHSWEKLHSGETLINSFAIEKTAKQQEENYANQHILTTSKPSTSETYSESSTFNDILPQMTKRSSSVAFYESLVPMDGETCAEKLLGETRQLSALKKTVIILFVYSKKIGFFTPLPLMEDCAHLLAVVWSFKLNEKKGFE